jgi:hypothetical protein
MMGQNQLIRGLEKKMTQERPELKSKMPGAK